MSITEMNNGDGVENGSGYSCLSIADEQEKQFRGGDRRIGEGGEKGMKEEREDDGVFLGSSSCSSIGKNSDDEDGDNEEEEVQSSYKCENGSFDSIQALEEALPMRYFFFYLLFFSFSIWYTEFDYVLGIVRSVGVCVFFWHF